MSDHQDDQACAILLKKVTAGQKLDEAEKKHLASCRGCLEELVGKLDETDTKDATSSGLPETSGDEALARARPEVRQALENARQIFAREFGIFIPVK